MDGKCRDNVGRLVGKWVDFSKYVGTRDGTHFHSPPCHALRRVEWVCDDVRCVTSRVRGCVCSKSAKAILFLAPLFGTHTLVTLVIPADAQAKHLLFILQATLQSFQARHATPPTTSPCPAIHTCRIQRLLQTCD